MAEERNDYVLAKATIEFNKADKIKLLNYLRISVGLGIFFTLVQATNIFLIDAKANNPITLGWGILTLLMTILNIANLVTSLRQTRAIGNDTDDYGSRSDNLQTRTLFVLNLFITFGFIIFFIIYKFAQTELWSHFEMLNQLRFLDSFKEYLAEKNAWINFLSLVNIGIGAHAVITFYALTGTQPAVRFYIFSCTSVLTLVSFLILNQYNVLKVVFNGQEHVFSFSNWNDRLTWCFAIVAIVIGVLMYLACQKRLKNGVLILGTLLLVLVSIQASAAGQIYRDYRSVDTHFRARCGPELAQIHRSFIETYPCQNKYIYENKLECPKSTATITQCIKDPHICDRTMIMRAWEDNITLDHSYPAYGCADEKCCGALYLIYSAPVLTYATLVLIWCLVAFALSAFSFLLSSKPTGDQLNSGIITVFFVILVVIFVVGFFLLGLYKIPVIPRRPAVTVALEESEQLLTPSHETHHNLAKSLRHGEVAGNAISHQHHLSNPASGDLYDKKDCKKLFNVVFDSNADRLLKYPAAATRQSEDISTWVPTDEVIPSTDTSVTNKGYLICIASYKKLADRNKPMFIVPNNFEILRNDNVFQLEGYSCAKNVIEAKNPTDAANKYDDEKSYIGFIGTKDAVDLVFKNDLEVCEDSQTTTAEKAANKFTVFVSEVDLEGHYGDRLLSKEFKKNRVIPPTKYPAADLTADQLKVTRTSFSLRLFNFTITDAENNRALLPLSEYAIQGELLSPNDANREQKFCEVDFDKAPIQQINKVQAHTVGYTNDIASSHIVIVLKAEKKPDPNAPVDPTKNNSPYVGSAAANLVLNYKLYGWRWNQDKVEFNCKEFQVNHNNKVTREEIQLSRNLNKDQIRVVLHWRDPTVNLDLLSTFRRKGDFLCNVAAFEENCGRARHFGETTEGLVSSTTEVIVVTNPGPFDYAFYTSTVIRNDNMTADPKLFQLRFRDSLPVITYYRYKDNNPYDQIVGVSRPFPQTPDTVFTSCTDDACKFSLAAIYNPTTAKDSNTKDFAIISFCVKGDDKHNPLNPTPKVGATQSVNTGVFWNYPTTNPTGDATWPDELKREKNPNQMFPTSDLCP